MRCWLVAQAFREAICPRSAVHYLLFMEEDLNEVQYIV